MLTNRQKVCRAATLSLRILVFLFSIAALFTGCETSEPVWHANPSKEQAAEEADSKTAIAPTDKSLVYVIRPADFLNFEKEDFLLGAGIDGVQMGALCPKSYCRRLVAPEDHKLRVWSYVKDGSGQEGVIANEISFRTKPAETVFFRTTFQILDYAIKIERVDESAARKMIDKYRLSQAFLIKRP